jgi:carboxylesterase type B
MELSLLVRSFQGMSRSFTDRKVDPAVDGDFVPALPGKLLLQGGFDKSLNIMAGHNIQYITQRLYPPVFDGSFGYTTETERGALWVTEAFFTCSTNYLARAYGEKTHNYIFSVPPSLHGDDIWYTYFDGPSPLVQNDTLAVIMQDYFTNFAITGNPNGPGLPNFPTYGSGSTVQNLDLATIGPIQDNAANKRCLWWQKGLFA